MRAIIPTAISFFVSALLLPHFALCADPPASPSSADVKWCLDRAADEIPNLGAKSQGSEPALIRLRAYLDLAKACFDAKETTSAQKMIDAAMQQCSLIPAWQTGMEPIKIIEVMCNTQNLDRAQRFAAQLPGTSGDLAYFTIAATRAHAGDIDAASIAADKISTTGPLADTLRPSAYEFIAAAHLRAGNPDAAKALLAAKKMLTDHSFASAQLASGDLAVAQAAASNANNPLQKFSILLEAALTQIRAQHHADALRLLDASESIAPSIPPREVKANRLLSTLYLRIALADHEGARKSIKLFTSVFDQPGIAPLERAYATLGMANSQANLGEYQLAFTLLEQIHLSDVPQPQLEPFQRRIAIATAVIYAHSVNLPAARAALPKPTGDPVKDESAIQVVASAAALAGKLEDVKKWAQESPTPEERFSIYLAAATGLHERATNQIHNNPSTPR
jgi:hypothetical protein